MNYGFPFFVLVTLSSTCWGETRFLNFDTDPLWDSLNNFNQSTAMRTVIQDFDYSTSTHCNASPGEIGGTVCPDGKPAYVAKPISSLTLEESFTASGTVYVGQGDGHTLLGFFNSSTVNEWRTPNTAAIRIYGRGSVFQVYFEYGTSLWRAGGGNMTPLEFASDTAYPWEITYTPSGAEDGQIDVTFNGSTASCSLDPGHRSDGATFNRFGLLNVVKHADTQGTIWIDDVVINGDAEDFSVDPGWEGFQNHANYLSPDTRPRFSFGYSSTQFASGPEPGEIGGRLFRGDCRFPQTLAYYGDVIADLSLESPLEASGKVNLRRAVSDSTTLFGFFHSEDSVFVNPSQSEGLPKDFLGLAIEGPSAEGFYMYPCYRTEIDGAGRTQATNLQYIYPDSQTKDWSFRYDPYGNSGGGEISLTYDGETSVLPLQPGHKAMGANFNRFGFVTTWVDGNGQLAYFDDLTYTFDVPTTAQFSATPRSGSAPLEVTFTDESSSKHTITEWTWDFGDNSAPSNQRNPVHTYFSDGAYTVGLTITTAEDLDTSTRHWYVDVGNSLPAQGVAAMVCLAVVMAGYASVRLWRP